MIPMLTSIANIEIGGLKENEIPGNHHLLRPKNKRKIKKSCLIITKKMPDDPEKGA